MSDLNLNTAIGEKPNEIWLRTGQVAVALSFFSFLGVNAFGINTGVHTELAPFVVLFCGIFMMAYGTKIAKDRLALDRQHEMYLTGDTGAPASLGDEEFLKYVKPLLPLNIKGIQKMKFPYDEKRTKQDLLLAAKYKRLEFWVNQGNIVRVGDTYDISDNNGSATETTFHYDQQ